MSIYADAKKFAEEFIVPYSKESDEKAQFPKESFKKMGEHGYFKLLIPVERGGQGKNIRDHLDICMAFAESCPSVGLCYMMHNVALSNVLAYGKLALVDKVVKDVIENNKVLALANSEFGTGTHFYKSEVTVKQDGDKTTFNGTKSMVTTAEYASYYATLTPSPAGGLNNWLFPLDTPGLSFQMGKWDGLGMRGNVSCPMKLENATLDSSYQLGDEDSGMEQTFKVVAPLFVLGLAGVYTGICLEQFRVAKDYSISRVYPDGKALSHIETVQIHLGNIYNRAFASQAMAREAARAALDGEPDVLEKILSARIFASESAIECSRLAMRIGGGKAYNRHTSIERFLRDAYAGQIMAPSVDVLAIWLGKTVTGLPLI
ncbi:MAG: acyl-CoA/acyl-ACP dehydrogenase [Treponema sp.]|jgi:alkylation response protein AidB-like acyl-CoA dehydrogenase|nr:acyl-CoA/acyl-ACP dehydrogenase [Treponema sp.]